MFFVPSDKVAEKLCDRWENQENTEILTKLVRKRLTRKSTKINLLDPETAGWGGDLPHEAVASKSSCPPSKVCLPLVLEGRSHVP